MDVSTGGVIGWGSLVKGDRSMEAFSIDLRERVIAAYDRGDGSTRQLAEVFGVSGS